LILLGVAVVAVVGYFLFFSRKPKFANAEEVGKKYRTYWKGKNVFVTGATAGIGKEMARVLCNTVGMNVFFGARNEARAKETIQDISKTENSGGGQLFPVFMDQADLNEVKEAMIKLKQHPKIVERGLDIFVMNAGIVLPQRELTEDKLEKTFVINQLSHFLMSKYLLPELQKKDSGKNKEEARIVLISSRSHSAVTLHIDDIHFENRPYKGVKSYGETKAYNVMFSNHLTTLLKKLGDQNLVPVTANSLYPGIVRTEIGRRTLLGRLVMAFIPGGLTVEEGTGVPMWVSLSDEVKGQSGKYYGLFAEQTPSKQAADPALCEELWNIQEKLVAKYLTQ